MRIRKKMLAALSGAVVAGTALAAISSTGIGAASADPGNKAKPTVTADAGGLDPSPGGVRPGHRPARRGLEQGAGHARADTWRATATVHPTRSYALLQTAIYDAVVSITHADAALRVQVVAPTNARPDAAADQAAHDILAALFPSFAAAAEPDARRRAGDHPDRPGEGRRPRRRRTRRHNHAGPARRRRVGRHPAAFVAGNQPGDYQLTPPNFAAPVFTNWGSVTPLVLDRGNQFRPPPPPPLTSPRGPRPSTRSRAWARTPARPGRPTRPRSPSSGRPHLEHLERDRRRPSARPQHQPRTGRTRVRRPQPDARRQHHRLL